jgi:DNA primase
MGTALTEDQAKLIRRYTQRVFLLYDSDKAGLKATFRSGDELLRQGASVQVVTLPEGEDPDTFVRTHGARGLEAQLASSIDVFERKIQILERGGWFADLPSQAPGARSAPADAACHERLPHARHVSRTRQRRGRCIA